MPANKKKAPAKKRAPRKQTSRAKQKAGMPGWVWLLTGIVAGLFIAFLFHLSGISPPIDTGTSKPAATDKKPTPEAKAEKPKTEEPRFDFYTMLPENEVEVPDQPEIEPTQKVIYVLQAGSFKSRADADKTRAKLLLLGMDASIDSSTNKSGVTWHRILVGPYTSRSKMSKARSTLVSNGVDVLLLKRKE